MNTIAIVASTDRPNSYALKIAKFTARKYEALGLSPEVISLDEFPAADVIGGPYGKDIPSVKAFNKRVLDKDGILFVIPEYNGSFPGIFKLFIDYLPFPQSFLGKPLAFIGEAAGSFGALRAVEHAQQVVGYRNAYVFPERVFISRVSKTFDPEIGLKDELISKLLDSQTKNFAAYIKNHFPIIDI